MAKASTIFRCSNCDSQFPKWSGRCAECGQWGTLVAEVGTGKKATAVPAGETVALHDVSRTSRIQRRETGWGELNRVLGGGLVPGSLVLLGGDPGIGKSTLVLQTAERLAAKQAKVLYVSGEESTDQIAGRLQRLTDRPAALDFLPSTMLETVLATVKKSAPDLVIIDSIQTMSSADALGEPGSVQQVRAVTARLMELAKKNGPAIILVGHVTKEGSMAGPKALEHLVDVVLYLEGDPLSPYRLLRSVKNRFGSTNDVGIFDMQDRGFVEVPNPSQIFLAERQDAPGGVATVILEGSRPLAVEVQALVNPTVFGMPRRTASGIDLNRLNVLAAVLSRRSGLKLASQDIFINVIGGLRIQERAADLAVCLAIASATADQALPANVIALGEVGLGGEIRQVPQIERRLQEAKKLGFSTAIIPAKAKVAALPGLTLERSASVNEALKLIRAPKKKN